MVPYDPLLLLMMQLMLFYLPYSLPPFFLQNFIVKISKLRVKLKDFYSEHPYTHYRDAVINILLYWLYQYVSI